ncbi:MAG: MFS transporter [Beijerinckiaceae bacterium]|nr:MFS transporter [Beijerinckiaceae bacterium]
MPSSQSLGAAFTPRETVRSLAAAIASVTIVGMGLSLTMPLLALRLDGQGYSAQAIGFNATAGGLAILAGAAAVPVLVRRAGVKRLLLLAILIASLGLLSFALTNDYWAWLLIRAVFGGALSILFVTSEYWINAIAPPRQRGFVLGFYATSLSAGFAAGPLILGFTGTDGLLPFIAGMVLFALAAAPVVVLSGKAPEIKSAPKVGFLIFLTSVPAATFAGLLHGAIETASLGLLPIYALRAGESPQTGALFVSLFALGNVVFQLPVGFASDRMGRGKLLIWLAVLGLCGAFAIALAGVSHLVVFCVLLVLWGGAVGSLYAVGLAHLGSRYSGADLASANAAFIMLYSVGMMAGPPVVGFGMDLISPDGLFLSIAALFALYLALARRQGPGHKTG